MTVKEILARAEKTLFGKGIESAILDSELLLLYALEKSPSRPKWLSKDRSSLYAHGEYPLDKKQEKYFFAALERRAKFEPVAYITGKKEFYGLGFRVNKNVLIPRPETEILVEECLKEILKATESGKKVVIADIGTGSGAIAVSIAKTFKNKRKISSPRFVGGEAGRVKIYATDISARALKIAKINAKITGVVKHISFKRGDLLKALPKNLKADFLLANLPYVGDDYYCKWLKNGSAPSEFHEIKYEPKKSLLAKNNGLEYFGKFFEQAPEYLAKNAKIFLESDPHQIPAIKKLAKKYLPKHKISVIKDLWGLDRITKIEIFA